MPGPCAGTEGSDTPNKAYEISKSLDFVEDFGISLKISRFHLRFPDFNFIFSVMSRGSVGVAQEDDGGESFRLVLPLSDTLSRSRHKRQGAGLCHVATALRLFC